MIKTLTHTLIIGAAFIGGFATHTLMDSRKDENFKAARIIDGDSFEIANIWLTKIRLNAIDTPEKGQLFYTEATQKLKALCFQKDIILKNKADGRFGRISADVYCDGTFVNPKIIEAGLAIVSIKHAKDAALYDIQNEARQNCRGIWSQDIRKIYDEDKLRAAAPNGEIVQIINNPDCKIKLASN